MAKKGSLFLTLTFSCIVLIVAQCNRNPTERNTDSLFLSSLLNSQGYVSFGDLIAVLLFCMGVALNLNKNRCRSDANYLTSFEAMYKSFVAISKQSKLKQRTEVMTQKWTADIKFMHW